MSMIKVEEAAGAANYSSKKSSPEHREHLGAGGSGSKMP
jgi:hypothetical protein